MIVQSLLAKCFLFRDLDPAQLGRIAEVATAANYGKGEIVFDAGQAGDSMFLVGTGSVVVKVADREIARLGSGSHFGELSLLDGQPRSACVQAGERTDVYVIPRDKFQALLDADCKLAAPVYRAFCRYLSGRLRHTNEQTVFLKELSQR